MVTFHKQRHFGGWTVLSRHGIVDVHADCRFWVAWRRRVCPGVAVRPCGFRVRVHDDREFSGRRSTMVVVAASSHDGHHYRQVERSTTGTEGQMMWQLNGARNTKVVRYKDSWMINRCRIIMSSFSKRREGKKSKKRAVLPESTSVTGEILVPPP